MFQSLAWRAHEFLSKYNTNPIVVDNNILRDLLDGYAHASGPRTPHGFAAWAQLLSIFVQPCAQPYDTKDSGRLWSYLDALQKKGVHTLMADGDEDDIIGQDHNGVVAYSKPAYDGLLQIAVHMQHVCDRVHPLLEPLMTNAVSPHALLVLLHQCVDQQFAYASIFHGSMLRFKHTALGAWMSVFAPTITGSWMPCDHEVYFHFWKVQPIPSSNEKDAQTQYMAYARFLMNQCPVHAAGGIQTLSVQLKESHLWPQELWDCFFPLPLQAFSFEKTPALLRELVVLVQQGRKMGQTHAEKMLQHHHPTLMQLLNMHFSLMGEAVNDLSCLVQAYLAEEVDTIVADDLLEDSSTH